MKVFLVRHQCAGILEGVVFEQEPTPEDLTRIHRALAYRYGNGPAGSDASWWIRVEAVETTTSVSKVVYDLTPPQHRDTVTMPRVRASARGTVE